MTIKNELKTLKILIGAALLDIKYYFIRAFLKEKYRITKGKALLLPDICFFCSFAPEGIASTTWKYLESLKENNFSIFLVSHSPLNIQDMRRLKELCFEISERENFGHDFGAYKFAFLRYKDIWTKANSLLMANDSVIALVTPLKEMFQEMQHIKCDFWGATEYIPYKKEMEYHIASFFLVFKKNILTSKAFSSFWENYKTTQDRKKIIRQGEILLSQTLIKKGFLPAAFISSKKILRLIEEQDVTQVFNLASSHMDIFRMKDWNVDKIGGLEKEGSERQKERMVNFLLTKNKHKLQLILLEYFRYPFIKKDIISKKFINRLALESFLSKNNFNLTKDDILRELK